MRTLVTGGAGFIGTHLVRELVRAAMRSSCSTRSRSRSTGAPSPELPASVELIVRRRRRPRARATARWRASTASCTWRPRSASGQSMYEIARYTERNTMQTAIVPGAAGGAAPAAGAPGRGLLDVDLRRGRVRVPTARPHGRCRPAAEEQLLARQWELVCPLCGAELAPVGTRETKALIPTSIYAITKRDHEELCLVTGAAYGIPAVALRFFNVYGPGQALSNPYTGVAAIFASRLLNGRAADHLRGRPAVARLHPRQRHRARDHARARVRAGRRTRDQPRHRSSRAPSCRSHRRCPPAWRSTSSRSSTASTGPGTSATAYADPERARELLGFEATDDAGGRDARSAGMARRARTRSIASTTRPASSPRAAWPAESQGSVRAPGTTRRPMADLAIVVVSTNEAHWLERCLSTVFDRRRRRQPRRDRGRQLLDRRHPRARGVGASRRLAS